MTGDAAGNKRSLQELVQFCKETISDGKPLIEKQEVRKALSSLAVEIEVQRLAGWYSSWRFAQREKLGPAQYELSNYYAKKLGASHAKRMIDILGLYGQLSTGSKWSALAGRLEKMWKVTRSLHAGGTFEVIKIVLAQRGLGLPRIPAHLMKAIGDSVMKSAKA